MREEAIAALEAAGYATNALERVRRLSEKTRERRLEECDLAPPVCGTGNIYHSEGGEVTCVALAVYLQSDDQAAPSESHSRPG